jgi:soluble lytic murein transglycosylase
MPDDDRRVRRALAPRGLRVLLVVLAAACARREVPEKAATPTQTASGAGFVEPPAAAGEPSRGDEGAVAEAPDGVQSSFPRAISLERWEQAWTHLEALPEAHKEKADVRYARARVALARGDGALAVRLLDGLEGVLPLLGDEVLRYRAEAQFRAGAYREAAEYFVGRLTPASQLKAAAAFERAGDTLRAKYACDRVILHEKRTRREEAEARERRFKLAGDVADVRWFAVHAPDLPFAKEAEAQLRKLDRKRGLTAPELMTRAQALGDAGRIDDAMRALDQVGTASGKRPKAVERLRVRAEIYYRSRKHYLEASRAFADAAALGGPTAADSAFLSARALSRADRDDDAITAYAAVARRYPKTRAAEQAAYLGPYLHFLHGRYKEAARGFDDYRAKFARGADRADALRNGAIASLLARDFQTARRKFEELAADRRGDALAFARARNLSALAAFRDGDRTHAVATWSEIARTYPLSWAALVARARLRDAAAAVPPHFDGGEASSETDASLQVRLPPPVDVLHRIGLDSDAETFLTTRERSLVAAAPGRSTELLCTAYGALDRGKRRYQIAAQIPSALLVNAPAAKTRWAWDCAYPRPYEEIVRAAEEQESLPRGLVYAVMRQESGFNPNARSPARAVGLMQLLPETARSTAEGLGPQSLFQSDEELTNPPRNIALGARYLRTVLEKARGNIALATASYNAGSEAVERWLSRDGGLELDLFVEKIPYAETRDYVMRVLGNLARYAYLLSGDAAVPELTLTIPR